MLELLIEGALWGQFQYNGQRIGADSDQWDNVRVLQVDQDV